MAETKYGKYFISGLLKKWYPGKKEAGWYLLTRDMIARKRL